MKKFLSLMLAMIMVMSLVTVGAGAADFTDADDVQYTEAVEVMTALGILTGYSDDSFRPQNPLTRQVAAKIIAYIALGTEEADDLICVEAPFIDVPATKTLAPYVAWIAKEGIVDGYDDGTFAPEANVSGHAFLKMVLGALGIEGEYTGDSWRLNVTTAAAEAKLFEGIDTTAIDLRADATRELACQIAFNAMNYTDSEDTILFRVTKGETLVYEGTDALTAAVAAMADGTTMEQVDVKADSLGWKNFQLAKGEGTDDFGRIAVVYTGIDDVEVVLVNEPVLTYTGSKKAGDIAVALGYTTNAKADDVKLNEVKDGVDEWTGLDTDTNTDDVNVMHAVTGTKDTKAFGNKGATVEIYKTESDKVYNVVVINTFAKQLSKNDIVAAKEASNGNEAVAAYIKVENESEIDAPTDTGAYKTDAYEEDDVILYTKANGKIMSVKLAECIEGVVTAVAGDDSYIRVNGEKMEISANIYNDLAIGEDAGLVYDKETEYAYFLDEYGYIVLVAGIVLDEVEAEYIYVIEADSKVIEGENDLFGAGTDDKAYSQVKVIDLATGVISTKNRAIVMDDDVWYYADAEGEATDVVVGNDDSLTAGIYDYVELEDGSIVVGDAAETSITIKKDKVDLGNGLSSTSKTVLTVVELTLKSDNSVKSAAVTNITNYTKFDDYVGTYDALVIADDDDIVSKIVIVKGATENDEDVNFAIYKGIGEVTSTTPYQFYVNGEVVSYTAKSGITVSLEKGDVVNLSLKDGKINTSVSEAETALVEGTVKFLDATFVIVTDESDDDHVIYFDTDCVIVDEATSYTVGELAVEDEIAIYTTDDKAEFIVIAK